MRISTSMLSDAALAGILADESALSSTQQKLASGQNISSPADDPVGAVQLLALNDASAQYQQYIANGQSANTSLTLEQSALSTATNTLQSIRDLLVQANNGANNAADLASIATEIKQLGASLLGTANSQDAQGQYLFAGYSVHTQPFVRGAAGAVNYVGDAGSASVPLDGGTSVQSGDPGGSVFMDVPAGNGTFTTAADAANTGTGVIDAGSVTDPSAWVPDRYTISFTDVTDWQVTDSGGATVASGTYDPSQGGTIAFRGVQVDVAGSPAAGDQFTVSSAGKQGVFDTVDGIVNALNGAGSTAAARAQLSSTLASAQQQIQQALNQVSTVTTSVGTRISLIGSLKTSVQGQSTAVAGQISNLNSLDYAKATSQYSQQYLALQAAEQSYAQLGQLSLFKYL